MSFNLDYNRDDFDRRNMPRDFFNQNRFAPPVPGTRGPMGMIRPGPLFGPRMGPPMFMRGPRPGVPGLPGQPIQGEYSFW